MAGSVKSAERSEEASCVATRVAVWFDRAQRGVMRHGDGGGARRRGEARRSFLASCEIPFLNETALMNQKPGRLGGVHSALDALLI